MAKKNNKSNHRDIKYIKLAYEQAQINLGSTSSNPSVGCIVVKNDSVISSGCTSINGRPHAENNALRKKIDYKNSEIFISLEPCSHHGKTPPCTDKIIKNKIKRVIFSVDDTDSRTKKKAEKKLKKKKISVKKNILKSFAKDFYQSYFLQFTDHIPHTDVKLAISKDMYTINQEGKWVTNTRSRKIGNFMRSRYDSLLTTSKTINDDNPLLNCRIEGLEKKSPSIIILDRSLNVKKNSSIFKKKKQNIFILTNTNNFSKEYFFKKKGIKILKFKKNSNKAIELKNIFQKIKTLGFNRIIVESGITFIEQLIKYNLIKNFYLFKSSSKLGKKGFNNTDPYYLKKISFSKKNKIKVNLLGDSLYKVKI